MIDRSIQRYRHAAPCTPALRARSALLCTIAAILLPAAAQAQGVDTQEDVSVPSEDVIVVTGTQLRGVAPVGSSLTTVDRDEIDAINATSTGQILQLQPQVFNTGISDSSRSGTGGAGNITNSYAINLRGISPYATLTLINGHRTVPTGTVGLSVDPSAIPTVMLERIDIVADGASATYGSDAIAGVANLIMRRGFDGVQVGGRYGFGDDYDEAQVNGLIGFDWGSGQLTVGGEYSLRSALNGQDRDFFRADLTDRGGADNRTINCFPGTITVDGVNYAIPDGGVTPATADRLVPGTQNLCSPIESQDLLPRQRQYSFAATFDQEITPRLRVFADGYYAKRKYRKEVPYAAGALTVTDANPYFVAPPGTGATSVVVNTWFGGQGLGDTWTDRGFSENWTVFGGAEYDLFGDWVATVQSSYGEDEDLSWQVRIDANSPEVAAALASTDPDTALNLFGPNSASVLDRIDDNLFGAPGFSKQWVAEAKLDGTVFTIPGGDVRAALGYQHQLDKVTTGLYLGTPDNYSAAFGGLSNLSRKSDAFYGEVYIPLVGPGNEMPFVYRLELDAGIRTTNYEVVGRTTDPKIGVNWAVNPSLEFRGSYGTSFRAPGLTQLVGPLTAIFVQTYATPTGPVQGYTTAGGNTGLQPESATTWSLGATVTPESVPGLRAAFTYWDIDYKNQINSYLSDLNILQNPELYAGVITTCPSAECSALIDKYITGTGPDPRPLPVLGPILANPAVFVNGFNENLASTQARGLDFDIGYDMALGGGDLSLGLAGTYYLDYKLAPTPGAPVRDLVNRINYPARWRARGKVGWNNGNLSAYTFVNYLGGYTNDQATPVQEVSALATVDISLAYTIDGFGPLEGVTLGLDVRNLFDTDPPFVNNVISPNGGGGFDPQAANPIGRVIGLSASMRM